MEVSVLVGVQLDVPGLFPATVRDHGSLEAAPRALVPASSRDLVSLEVGWSPAEDRVPRAAPARAPELRTSRSSVADGG